MQVKWPLFPFLLFILFLYALPASGRNESNGGMAAPEPDPLPRREQEDDSLSVGFGYYRQDDGPNDEGGNSNIDEDETVYEAIIILDKTLNDRDRLNVNFIGDIISSASQTRLHNPQFGALQSNPSGNKRFALGAGWQRQLTESTFGFNGSFGAERSNYYSGGYGGNFAKSFREAHTNLSFSFQGYTDYFQIKLFNGIEPGYDYRQTLSAEIGLTQILSRRTIANLSFHHTHQFGFLATTFNSVFINGVEFSEEAPSKRRRNAITARR